MDRQDRREDRSVWLYQHTYDRLQRIALFQHMSLRALVSELVFHREAEIIEKMQPFERARYFNPRQKWSRGYSKRTCDYDTRGDPRAAARARLYAVLPDNRSYWDGRLQTYQSIFD